MSRAQITSRPISHLIPRLAQRDGTCGTGAHGCLDIGRSDRCCNNDSYCYIDKIGEARCCPIGSNCPGDSNCQSEAYYCTVTTTISGDFTTDQKGCCNRKCPQTSYYLCPPDQGGNCCPYGSECQAGGNCLKRKTAAPTSATSVSSVATASCVAVCSVSQSCSGTYSSSPSSLTGVCVAVDSEDSPGNTLSSGARTGIGIGVGIGTSIIFGILVWLCMSRRRRRRNQAFAEDTGTEKQTGPPDCAEMVGTVPPAAKGHPDHNEAGSQSAITCGVGSLDALNRRQHVGNESGTLDICSTHQSSECLALAATAPVEISSTELSRPTYELSATSAVPAAHRVAHIEEVVGIFELDGLEIGSRESSESGRLSRLQHIPYDKEMQDYSE